MWKVEGTFSTLQTFSTLHTISGRNSRWTQNLLQAGCEQDNGLTLLKIVRGEWSKSRWLLCTAWPLQKCLLLLAAKGKGGRPYAEWICGSMSTGGGFLLLSISKVNSFHKRNSFRDWRKHADGFAGKRYKGLEKCLTMLPDSNTFISVPDTQTLDVVLTALLIIPAFESQWIRYSEPPNPCGRAMWNQISFRCSEPYPRMNLQ